MVAMKRVEKQLERLGVASSFKFFGKPEIRELSHILMSGETIKFCMNGRWEGGWAVLCITDYRILLIDKKILFLSLEDLRYDMVVEVDYSYKFLDASVKICTPNRDLHFMSYKKDQLRQAATYIQTRVMELRQMHAMQPGLVPDAAPIAQNVADVPVAATSVNPLKPFVPKLPARRLMNPYTHPPLVVRKRIPRFYQTEQR